MSSSLPADSLGTPVLSRYRLALVREPNEAFDSEAPEGAPLGDPERVATWLQRRLADEPAELMGALFLDVRNRLIGYTIAYRGTIARAAVEPRGILAPALLVNAGGVVLFHNHPSGDPSPSAEDLAFTRRLADAGEILGIRLLDHVIIGDAGRWTSLRRRGGW